MEEKKAPTWARIWEEVPMTEEDVETFLEMSKAPSVIVERLRRLGSLAPRSLDHGKVTTQTTGDSEG